MSITRYEDEVYGPSSYDFEKNESGSWVKYEDHAAEVDRLNEQVQALAAENAQIKSAIESHAAGFVVCPVCSHEEPSGTDDVVWMVRDIGTPATDAAIREIGAKAIDEVADHIDYLDEKMMISTTSLREYASQLRARDVQP